MATKKQAPAAQTEANEVATIERPQPNPVEAPMVPGFLATAQGQIGKEAKGFAFAQRVAASIGTVAQELGKLAREMFVMDQETRTHALKAIGAWQNNLRKAAKEGTPPKGYTVKDLEKAANSFTTRASQFRLIGRAITAGLGMDEIKRQTGRDFDDVGFDGVKMIAQKWVDTHASDGTAKEQRGRPAIEAFIKLWNYAEKLEPINAKDKKHVTAAKDALQSLVDEFGIKLPEKKNSGDNVDGTPDTKQTHTGKVTADKAPRRVKAPAKK